LEDEDFEELEWVIGFSEEELGSCSGIQIWRMKMTTGKVSPELILFRAVQFIDSIRNNVPLKRRHCKKGAAAKRIAFLPLDPFRVASFLWRSSSSMKLVEWGRQEIL
jgi:hypothetical protein